MTTELSYTIDHVQILQKELEAAKQRELELLAVIEKMKQAKFNYAHPSNLGNWSWADSMREFDAAFNIEPSQALREHEAKVLEEAAKFFDGESYTTRDENSCVMDFAENQLRRMAEERRKK